MTVKEYNDSVPAAGDKDRIGGLKIMAKKQKRKAELFETVQFQDFNRAKREVSFAKINQIRILIGLVLAAIATYLSISGLINQTEAWVGGFALGICAYLIGGGIGKAIKTAWNITKIGWFLIPFFPFDFCLALACFLFSLYGLVFVPVIFVGMNYIQHKKTLDAAKRYLAECGRAVSAVEE